MKYEQSSRSNVLFYLSQDEDFWLYGHDSPLIIVDRQKLINESFDLRYLKPFCRG